MDEIAFRPPYMSFQTFWSFLTDLVAVPLPPKIDRSVMTGKSGTDQANLFQAFQAFGFIDAEHHVQPVLVDFAAADADGRKAILRSAIELQYAPALAVSAENGTSQQLHDAFKDAYDLDAADTRRKAVTFFLHAARVADIPLSPRFPNTRGGSGSPGTPRAPRAANKRSRNNPPAGAAVKPPAGSGTSSGDSYTVTLRSGGVVSVDVSVNLFALSRDDRDFVLELIDRLKEYDQAAPDPAPSAADEYVLAGA